MFKYIGVLVFSSGCLVRIFNSGTILIGSDINQDVIMQGEMGISRSVYSYDHGAMQNA